METPALEVQLKTLPNSPGVYQYYDKNGKILYVGKAKNLKKRVTSYFTKRHDSHRIGVMVKKIKEIKHIVVYATITQEQVLKGSMKTCSYSIRW